MLNMYILCFHNYMKTLKLLTVKISKAAQCISFIWESIIYNVLWPGVNYKMKAVEPKLIVFNFLVSVVIFKISSYDCMVVGSRSVVSTKLAGTNSCFQHFDHLMHPCITKITVFGSTQCPSKGIYICQISCNKLVWNISRFKALN